MGACAPLVTRSNVFVMSETVAQIIIEKGGPLAVATRVGWAAGAVRAWKHRGVIPRDAWPDLMREFPDITLERLIASEVRRPRRCRPGLAA